MQAYYQIKNGERPELKFNEQSSISLMAILSNYHNSESLKFIVLLLTYSQNCEQSIQ